jgi:hypothetical protein
MDGGRPVGGRRPLAHLWPLACEHKHRHLMTSGNASITRLTLAFGVVACRLLLSGCRAFAACSPPAAHSRRLAVEAGLSSPGPLRRLVLAGAGSPVGCLPPWA